MKTLVQRKLKENDLCWAIFGNTDLSYLVKNKIIAWEVERAHEKNVVPVIKASALKSTLLRALFECD